MISFVEKNARRIPGTAASRAPPAAPASIIAAITTGDGAPPSSSPTVAPVIAPAYSWPSPPMLNRFIRNATAAASPVKASGVAATSVSLSAPLPRNAASQSRLKVCSGGGGGAGRTTGAEKNAARDEETGTPKGRQRGRPGP